MKETLENNGLNYKFQCPTSFELTQFDTNGSITSLEVGDNSQMWLIQTPANLMLSDLNRRKISLRKSTRVQGKISNYSVTVSKCKDIKRIAVLVPDLENKNYIAASQKMKGQLTFVETVPCIPEYVPEVQPKIKVSFPSGLRQRFYPFGAKIPTDQQKSKKKKQDKRDSLDANDIKKKIKKDDLKTKHEKKRKKGGFKARHEKKKLKGVSNKSKKIKHKKKHKLKESLKKKQEKNQTLHM